MISQNKILLGALVILVIGIVSFISTGFISPVVLIPIILASIIPGLPSFLVFFLGFSPLMAFYYLWSKFYLKPTFIIVVPTVLLTFFIIVLSGIYNISNYKYGIKHQGESYILFMYGLNILCIVLLRFIFKVNNSNPTANTSLGYNILLFFWLGLIAFPYLG